MKGRIKKYLLKGDVLLQIDRQDILHRQQFVLFRIFSLTASAVALVAFFQLSMGVGKPGLFHWLIFFTSCILLANFLFLKSTAQLKKAYLISLITAFALLHLVMYKSGGIRTSGSVYFTIIVIYSYALLGKKIGRYFTAAAIAHITYVFIISSTTNWANFDMMNNEVSLINRDFLINFVLVFLMLAFVHSYLEKGKLIIIKNITKNRDELQRKNSLLTEYNKTLKETNSELEKFANVMSHDLKAPLRAIGSLTDLTERDLNKTLNEEQKSNFSLIKGRVQRMENLINGLLQYTKSGRSQDVIEPVDTGLLIHEIAHKLNIPDSCTLKISGPMPLVKSDKLKLQQVFSELIQNSITHANSTQTEITVSATEDQIHWNFSVADNGPGIEEKYFEKIFVIFQTLNPRDTVDTRGIGLSIAKRIVTSLGGNITVQSKMGEGCTFMFSVAKETINSDRKKVLENIA